MSGPLEGVRILDLTWVLAGPFASMVLCDLGADVIKVERPPIGDVARTTAPLVNGESCYFFSVNRGKKSICLDLKTEAGRDLFLRLVERVDVVMENFTPGTMEGLGLGYDVLCAAQPAPHLRRHLRLRADGPRPPAAGPGHRSAGHGRRHEHHRRARGAARAPRHFPGRHRRRPVHGHRRAGRPPRAGAQRPRPDDRRRHAGLPGRDTGERLRPLLRHRRGAGAHRHAPPGRHPLPGLPHPRRLHRPRPELGGGEPVGALLRHHRPPGPHR